MNFIYHKTLKTKFCMFAFIWDGTKETSTSEVKSLPRLRLPLTSINKFQIRDLEFIEARSAELSLAVFNPNYFGDFAKIISLKHRAEVKKVVNSASHFYVNN